MTFGNIANKKATKYAKKLRKNMTRQERHLWYDFLRNLSIRWYRQKPIGNYIADFYCDKLKIIIEVDGGQHYEKNALEYDDIRTDFFRNLGLKVIRFPNNDVDKNFEGVCEEIIKIMKMSES